MTINPKFNSHIMFIKYKNMIHKLSISDYNKVFKRYRLINTDDSNEKELSNEMNLNKINIFVG